MFDGKAFGEQMVEVVRSYVDEATGPLLKRIEAQDREIESLKSLAAQSGKDGVDGKDCDMEAVFARIDEAVSALPAAINGKDGTDGAPGENGSDGAPGERGQDGKDGADGIGLAGAVIDRNGELVITLTNGEAKALGPVVGKNGRDGTDGARGEAGFSLSDFDTEFRHTDKVLVLKFDGGDVLETHEIFLPYVRDCGVWKEATEYLQGDGVTWGGSFWTAQKDTTSKPDGSDDWRLAVKRGRDGKDFTGVKG